MKTSFVVILAAGLVLLLSAAGHAPAAAPHAPAVSAMPHAGGPHSFGAVKAASSNDVTLNTQPCNAANWCWVMRTNTDYAIYWMPSGSTCGAVSCANYQSTVNRYFTDVAAASGANTNVYSDATQYYDATGAIAYNSTFGGSYVDTTPFPASGCTDGSDPVCVDDQALEAEIQSVITAQHWPDGKTSLFFVMLPSGIGSCYGGTHCTTDPQTGWCAYHSGFMGANSSPILYANEPFDGTITGCHGAVGQGFPNGVDADATINTISHEQNEAISDPWGNAWFNANYEEIADLCAWVFGSQLGTTNGEPYNQLINGHPYSLQEEYSNDGSTCVQRYGSAASPTSPTNSARPVVSGTAAVGHTLSTTNGTWSGSPTSYAYQWLRCTANGKSCASVGGATALDLRRRSGGRRVLARGPRLGDERRGNRGGDLCCHGARRGQAERVACAADRGYGQGRQAPRRDDGDVDRPSHRLPVHVAPLQCGRPPLRTDSRRNRGDLRRESRRPRAPAAGACHRGERGRKCCSDLERHRPHPGEA